MELISLDNCTIFDGSSEELIERGSVVVEGEIIKEIESSQSSFKSIRHIDCDGKFLMPGLIDCHFHSYTPSFDLYDTDRMPASLLTLHAAVLLEQSLSRGFTTVRDAGGGDIGLALGIQKGLIKGPRFFYSGKAISQTGGHGDIRPSERVEPCSCSYSGVQSVVADGVDEVRRAVREELRKGASQIKLYLSGGVLSPTDPIWMSQFSADEIKAAVSEAATRGKYVMAHCHTDKCAKDCVKYGIRTIEHGTEISEETASLIANSDSDTYVVPTLSILDVLRRHGQGLGIAKNNIKEINNLYNSMLQSIDICTKSGVKLGMGTDLLGTFHHKQGGEFQLRAEINRPIDVLRSATCINAEILQMKGKLGCIAPGAYADLILLEKNPLNDLSLLDNSHESMKLIMRAGQLIKNII